MLCSCASPKVITTWKASPSIEWSYQRILVAVILPERDSMLRRKIETEAVRGLNSIGYHAISSISAYGPKGLASTGEEATYLKLCSSGIDAVMTFALVSAEIQYQATNPYRHSNNYYYNRIWSYKKMQADTINTGPETEYFWESMLFDLVTLEAVSTIRTRSFTREDGPKFTNDLAALIIKRMIKEKIIKKAESHLKAF